MMHVSMFYLGIALVVAVLVTALTKFAPGMY
jgi:hypothetical protein